MKKFFGRAEPSGFYPINLDSLALESLKISLEGRIEKIENELKVMKCDHPIIKREMKAGMYPSPAPNYFERCGLCGKTISFIESSDAMKKRQREIDLELSEYYRKRAEGE